MYRKRKECNTNTKMKTDTKGNERHNKQGKGQRKQKYDTITGNIDITTGQQK